MRNFKMSFEIKAQLKDSQILNGLCTENRIGFERRQYFKEVVGIINKHVPLDVLPS